MLGNEYMQDGFPRKRVADYYADISGPNHQGRPKARIMLRYYNSYSDGTETELASVVVEKPILSVFEHAAFVNVRMDFSQSIDLDLREIWDMLDKYSNPINSVSYTDEEMEAGYYSDEEGEHLVYFPMIDVIISPIGKEKEYALTGVNPAFYTLQPRDPSGEPCVLQLTFPSDWFVVTEKPEVDLDAIQREVALDFGTEPHA